MRYERYYIGQTKEHKGLFHQLRGKESAPNRVSDGSINMINETSLNNGIQKKAFSLHVFDAPAITVSVNFAQTVFFQEENFCASVNILILKNKWLEEYPKAALYVVSCLHKNNQKYNYSFKISKDRLNDTYITLPTLDEIDENSPYSDEGFMPDFEYMEFRIAELEKERIAELENYLIVTGLNDYTLTDEDKEILKTQLSDRGGCKQNSISGNGCLKETKQFKIGDLFIVEGTKSLNAGDLKFKNNGINFIGRTGDNNGIQGKIDKQSFEPNKAGTLTVTVIGNYKYVKYQENPYYCSQNINKLTPIFDMTSLLSLYFICPIQNFVNLYNGKQSGYKLDELKNHAFELPIQTDDDNNPIIDENYTYHPEGYIPDFEYMERYIKAIEKLVIKDVVDWKDNVISQTKKCSCI